MNVRVCGLYTNLLMLALAGAFVVWDLLRFDATMAVYLVKTFGGDFLAGKLDTFEWRAVLLFTMALVMTVPYFGVAGGAALFVFEGGLGRVLLLLFLAQLFCEYGDNHWEKWTFFRHRYSYEATSLALLGA